MSHARKRQMRGADDNAGFGGLIKQHLSGSRGRGAIGIQHHRDVRMVELNGTEMNAVADRPERVFATAKDIGRVAGGVARSAGDRGPDIDIPSPISD